MESVIKSWLDKYSAEKIHDTVPLFPQLKSGLLLCKAINAHRPNLISRIGVGAMSYVAKENVRSFLKACDTIGVPSRDIFQIEDLLDEKSEERVYRTILRLIKIVTPEFLTDTPFANIFEDEPEENGTERTSKNRNGDNSSSFLSTSAPALSIPPPTEENSSITNSPQNQKSQSRKFEKFFKKGWTKGSDSQKNLLANSQQNIENPQASAPVPIPPSQNELQENARLRSEIEKLYIDRKILRERVQFNFPEKYRSFTVYEDLLKSDEGKVSANAFFQSIPENSVENDYLKTEECKLLNEIFTLSSVLAVVEENRGLRVRIEEMQKMVDTIHQDKKALQARLDEMLADKTQAELMAQETHEEGLQFSEYKGKTEIKGGTPERLVERLYSKSVIGSVSEYVDTFLLTYRAFTSSKKVFEMLSRTYNINRIEDDSQVTVLENGEEGGESVASSGIQIEQEKLTKKKLRLRICNFLKRWVDGYFHDFDVDLVTEFNAFIAQYSDDTIMQLLKKSLDKKLAGNSTLNRNTFVFSTPPPQPVLPKGWTSVNSGGILNLEDIDEKELARQLTLIEYDLYKNIPAKELLQLGWQKQDRETRSPNLLKMIARFNLVNNWVVTTLVKENSLKKRVSILKKFVKLAEELKKLGNFNAVFVVVSALHSASVNRLRKTWEELGRKEEKMFEEYDQLTSPNGSFINYREELHNANPPCIPYMGVYLSDLTFIEEGNPDKLENGQVNFFKCRMVAEVIKEIQQYQQKPYNLIAVPAIISYLNNIKTLSANDLFKLSLVAEPREPQPQ